MRGNGNQILQAQLKLQKLLPNYLHRPPESKLVHVFFSFNAVRDYVYTEQMLTFDVMRTELYGCVQYFILHAVPH